MSPSNSNEILEDPTITIVDKFLVDSFFVVIRRLNELPQDLTPIVNKFLFNFLSAAVTRLNEEIPKDLTTKIDQFSWACKEGNIRIAKTLFSIYKVEITRHRTINKEIFKTSCENMQWELSDWLIEALEIQEKTINKTFMKLILEDASLDIVDKFIEKYNVVANISKNQIVTLIPDLSMKIHKHLCDIYDLPSGNCVVAFVLGRIRNMPYPDTIFLSWLNDTYHFPQDNFLQ